MPTVTLGQLKGSVWSSLENNTRFYPDDQVTDAINDAVKALNLFTGFVVGTVDSTSIANRTIYDAPPSVLVPMKVEFEGRALEPRSVVSMGHDRPNWIKETTDSVAMPVESWVPIGITKYAIHPGDSRGGATIRITGVLEPDVLVNDDDIIWFPDAYADALTDAATHYLPLKGSGYVATAAMAMYQSFLGRMNELKRFKSKINPQFYVEVQKDK